MKKLIFLTFVLGYLASANVFSLNPDMNFSIFNNKVSKIFVDDSTNKIYFGGDFTNIKAYTGSSALFDLNGYRLIYPWPKIKGQVYSIISDNNGGWYIGGDFDAVDNYNLKNLVHILADGTVNQNFRFEPNGYVNTLLLVSSTLYVGGMFDKINDQSRNNLAAIDVNNNSLIDWDPQIDGVVFSMAVSSSTLYVGGMFDSIGTTTRYGLAAFDLNNRNLTFWQPRIEVEIPWIGTVIGTVNTLLISSSTLYVGGSFNRVDNQSRGGLAAFDLNTGELLVTWQGGVDGEIYAITASESALYTYGFFNQANGEIRNSLAAFNLNTGELLPWQIDKQIDPLLPFGVIIVDNQNIYVGGSFDLRDEFDRNFLRTNFAVFDKNNGYFKDDFNPDFDGYVYTIAINNGKIYLGGYFDTVVKEKRKYLAIFSSDGNLLSANLNVDNEISGDIYAIKKIANKIFVSGRYEFDFRFQSSPTVYFLKIFDSNDNEIRYYETDGPIYDLTVVSSTVYLGGDFSSINGIPVNNLAALDIETNDLLETDSLHLISTTSAVSSEYIKILANKPPYLFIGGYFSKIGSYNLGEAKNRVIVFKLVDGNIDNIQDIVANREINSLAFATSTIYIGGNFNVIAGNNLNYLAVLDVNDQGFISLSSKLSSFVPDGCVNDVKIISDILYLGGCFEKISGQPRTKIAAIDLKTEKLLNWNPRVNTSSVVLTLDDSQSALYVGGNLLLNDINLPVNILKFDKLIFPSISNIKLNNTYPNNSTLPANTTQVILTFNTDKPAICRYATTSNIDFDAMVNNIDTSDGLSHLTTFFNLQGNATYIYYLKCRAQNNSDLKNREDYIVNFIIQASSQENSSGGRSSTGGGFSSGGGGYRSAATTSTTTISQDNEALRLFLLQLILQLLSQKLSLPQEKTQTSNQSLPSSIPQNYQFSKILSLGSRGLDVAYLQIFLRQQGENIKITGIFNEETKQAVIRFQEKYKDEILTPQGLSRGTGRVSAYTLRKINQILGRETIAQRGVITSGLKPSQKLQTNNSITTTTIIKATSTESISFNMATNNLIFRTSSPLSSQEQMGLLGVIQELLSRQTALISNQSLPSSIPQNYQFSKILSLGSRGLDVAYLQIFLRQQGENIKITGIFNEETKQAVIRFQEKYKDEILTPQGLSRGTGRVDSYTLRKINQLLKF